MTWDFLPRPKDPREEEDAEMFEGVGQEHEEYGDGFSEVKDSQDEGDQGSEGGERSEASEPGKIGMGGLTVPTTKRHLLKDTRRRKVDERGEWGW